MESNAGQLHFVSVTKYPSWLIENESVVGNVMVIHRFHFPQQNKIKSKETLARL